MALLYFLLIGLIAGWLAGRIMRGGGYGLIGDMIIGIVGALIGGHIMAWLGFYAGGLLGRIVTALVGAIILIFLIRLVKRV